MSEKTTNFINTIGVLVRNEFLSRDRWVLPSVCIAQAALESGWNLNAKTLFGIKGNGFLFYNFLLSVQLLCSYLLHFLIFLV